MQSRRAARLCGRRASGYPVPMSIRSGTAAPRPTPLAALHERLAARMVDFAGWSLPVQYPAGIRREHLHTRAAASLFDVSHMAQLAIEADAATLEDVLPIDVRGLAPWRQRYGLLTDEAGGIVDDLVLTRLPQGFFAVVNAARVDAVLEHLATFPGLAGCVRLLEDRALLALQGPAAAAVLADLGPALDDLPFMAVREAQLDGVACRLHRGGYTGEDGFEIALPAAQATSLAEVLLRDSRVAPAGLGARDSLRLEAGLCLSGTDIGPDTTPAEAGLGWVVARRYRDGAEAARFPGAATVLRQLAGDCARRRVGIRPAGRAPVRGGTALHTAQGEEVGTITSGGFGPSVEHPIAMGYVARSAATPGTRLVVSLRGREHEVEVASLPFVAHRYHRS